MATSKKSIVTEENRQESERLKALWDAHTTKKSQAEFAEEYGLGTQGNVGHYLLGRSALNPKSAAAFAAALGCKVSDFSHRVAKEIEALTSTATGTASLNAPSPYLKASGGPSNSAVAPVNGAETAMDLGIALRVLGEWIENSDDLQRDQVRPLVNRMFDEPKRSSEIVARISATVSVSIPTTKKVGHEERPDFLKG